MFQAMPTAPLNDFGCIADVYDELVSWAPNDAWVEGLERRLCAWGLARGAWVLDAACGTGLSTLPWLRRGYRVTGVDVSEAMLARARERVRQAGLEAEFFCQPLSALDLPRQFDLAVCMHSGLDYIQDDAELERAFASLRRCLKTGGLLAFDKCLDEPSFYRPDSEEVRHLSYGRVHFHYRWDKRRRLMEQLCTVERFQGGKLVRTRVVYWLKATPPDLLLAMLERAGFQMLEPVRQFTVADPGMGIFRAVGQ